ncbi:MAG: ABC transporter ATP-binding protein [Sciscionella sp.]|nr:ABC transporter ATP-binding protein [Sciscionella sp.]
MRKVYRGTVAVDSLDLEVPTGAVLGMLGPNGSGKTTTIRMLLGLVLPTSGEVELLGRAMPAGATQALPEVGALVEGPGFHPFLSGQENLRRVAAAEPLLAGNKIRAAIDDALARVDLTGAATRKYKAYSLGMKQRLGLAAALLVPRKLVILDEPTNGLDPAGTKEIRKVIADLHSSGTTVIVSSHLLSEVENTCTHVAVLNQGSVVAQGELSEMLESGSPTLSVRTPARADAIDALRAARIPARATGDELLVDLTATTAPAVLRILINAGIDVEEARRARTGLEDLFSRLTERDSDHEADHEADHDAERGSKRDAEKEMR